MNNLINSLAFRKVLKKYNLTPQKKASSFKCIVRKPQHGQPYIDLT